MKNKLLISIILIGAIACDPIPPVGGGTPKCKSDGISSTVDHQCLDKSYTIKNEVVQNVFNIDVDADGVVDFIFVSKNNGQVATSGLTPSSNFVLEIIPTENAYLRADYYSPTLIQVSAKGQKIGPTFTDPWGSTHEQPYFNSPFNIIEYTASNNPKQISYSNYLLYAAINDNKDKITAFVGFYLQKNDGRYYGWIRVNAESTVRTSCNINGCTTLQALAKKITFIDVAISKTPNSEVEAGK